MGDNEANRANFEELKGHIDLASKRLKALQPGTETHTQSLEDLEDYYERTVQLRRIQADTAIEERDDMRRGLQTASVRMVLIITLLLGVIVAQFVWLAPGTASSLWEDIGPYATIDRATLVLIVIATVAWRT